MTFLGVSIMAHPKRRQWVDELCEALYQTDAITPPIAWDRHSNEWDTGSRAWEMADPATDYHLVLQDDVVVAPDMLVRARLFLDDHPHDGPVSLYLGTGRPRQTQVARYIAAADGDSILMPWLLWGPAVILPTARIPEMLRACRSGHVEYDRRISHHFERQGIQTLYTWPSLVDHRDEGSLLGHDDKNVVRRAHRFDT